MKVMFNEMVNNIDTQIFITKTVTQLLFDGYDDPLLDAASVIKYLVNISIPFDKFGWFYSVSDLCDVLALRYGIAEPNTGQ